MTKGVFDSVVETASFEDKLYGAPFNTNTQLLWYRTDRGAKRRPATWDEMIDEAERIGPAGGLIQVQANQYEGFTVWFNAMIESAGGQILSGPETVDLPEGPTDEALAVMGRLANSPVAAPDIDTSTEDTARLGFEAGDSAFMVNYTFALASAQANAPDVAKNMGFGQVPGGGRRTSQAGRRSAGSTSASAPSPTTPSSPSRPPRASATRRAS